ncbi:hypothetical protein TWF751_007806 [Orbilia oligospora]|nr:hypothetical protein TWF751_007806 [Orbilia oligospora]
MCIRMHARRASREQDKLDATNMLPQANGIETSQPISLSNAPVPSYKLALKEKAPFLSRAYCLCEFCFFHFAASERQDKPMHHRASLSSLKEEPDPHSINPSLLSTS